MPTKQAARRGPNKKTTRGSVNVVTREEVQAEGRGKKVVAAKVKGKGKAVVAEEDVNEDAIEDLACQRKGTKKKVTFSVGNSKGKDKVVEEEEEIEESGEEEADEDEQEDDNEEDRPLKPKALKVVKGKAEVGEGSKKRKRDDSSLVVGKKKKEVDGHGSPRQLFNLIAILTDAKKKDIEVIDFGGILELKTHAFYHQMVDWLLHKYDPSSRMFLFNRHVQFVLTKHDVYDAFMLPCTDKTIEPRTDQEFAQIWREGFKVTKKDEISIESVRVTMLGLPDGGADFKKMFVVFAMGTFLAPTVHNRIDLRLVKAVEDVDSIS